MYKEATHEKTEDYFFVSLLEVSPENASFLNEIATASCSPLERLGKRFFANCFPGLLSFPLEVK